MLCGKFVCVCVYVHRYYSVGVHARTATRRLAKYDLPSELH